MRSALESGNVRTAKSVLSEFVEPVEDHQTAFSIGEADRTIQEFIILLNDMALELGVAS